MKFKVFKTQNGANNALDLEAKMNAWAEKEKPTSIQIEITADTNGYLYAIVTYDRA
jgi:hypothetical protein